MIAAVVGVLVLLVVIVVLLRPSLELKPPGASSVDRGIRRGSAQTIECDLVGKTFIPKGRLSVTGRICASRPLSAVDGVISVVLLLGAGAADDGLAAANITYNNQVIENIPPGAVVLHLITKEKIDVTKGAYLSVLGDYGQLAEGSLIVSATEQGDVVAVDQLRQ